MNRLFLQKIQCFDVLYTFIQIPRMSSARAHADTSLFRNKVYMLKIIVLFEYGNMQVIFPNSMEK